jgi:hypothetical protein
MQENKMYKVCFLLPVLYPIGKAFINACKVEIVHDKRVWATIAVPLS